MRLLIDNLVRELPGRGGWPEGAISACQDDDGEVSFVESGTLRFNFFAWHCRGEWFDSAKWFYCDKSSDFETSIVTREQYESAIAALAPQCQCWQVGVIGDAVAEAVSELEHAAAKKNAYLREIKPGVWVDVYDVLNVWAVTNPALQHLLKKALQPGERGHKSRERDLQDIIDSAIRAKELEIGK